MTMYVPAWADPIPDLPRAACKGAPLELFVITSRSGQPATLSYDNEEGLAMCGACPERVPCARLPLDRDGLIFGGIAYGPRRPQGGPNILATAPEPESTQPVRCTHCEGRYDLATVEVTRRHADCSTWRAPCCGRLVDDRKPPLVHRPAYTPLRGAA